MAYFLQEEPQDSVTIMNNAVRNGAIQEQQNLIDKARQAAIEQDPTLSFVNRQIASGLLGAKTAWQDAFNKGDAQGMVNAQKAADSLRQQAASIGWDANGYGADVSLEQAAQNLANNDTRAINNIFYNLQDSDDLYTQGVADYLDKGYSIDSAKRLAGQNADRNTRGNINQLIDAYHMYGTDPRGAINQNGLRLLGMMAQQGGVSPSELVNFYAKMQASPKDNWNFENSLLTAQNAQNYALDRMARSQEYNVANQERAFAQQERMKQLDNDLGIQRMMAQAQIQINSGIMSREAGYNWMVQKLVEAGVDEQTARQYAAAQLIGGKGKGTGSRLDSTQVKHLEEELKAARADYNAWRDMNQDKDPSAYPGYARLQQLEAMSNSILGFSNGGSNGNSVYSEIANDYDKFRDFYQKALDDAANDPSVTYADIIAHAEQVNKEFADNFFDDSYRNAKRPGAKEPPKETKSESEPPRRVATSNTTINPSYNNGQQIVVPQGVQNQIAEAAKGILQDAVHGRTNIDPMREEYLRKMTR